MNLYLVQGEAFTKGVGGRVYHGAVALETAFIGIHPVNGIMPEGFAETDDVIAFTHASHVKGPGGRYRWEAIASGFDGRICCGPNGKRLKAHAPTRAEARAAMRVLLRQHGWVPCGTEGFFYVEEI